MEKPATLSAVAQLGEWYDRERAENGLLELTFCPGSDREVGTEEAAAVALAMLQYKS